MHRLAYGLREEEDMIREVFFRGVSTKGSEYNCADGELEYADGVENDGGGLKNQTYAELIGVLPAGARLLYMHDLPGGGRNYIMYKDGVLRWSDSVEEEGTALTAVETVHTLTSVGNVLCAMTNEGMVYAVWKDGAYTMLYGKLPELDVEMGLEGDFVVEKYDEPVYRANGLYTDDYEEIMGSASFGWGRGESRGESKTSSAVIEGEYVKDTTYQLTMAKEGDFYLNIEEMSLVWTYEEEDDRLLTEKMDLPAVKYTDWEAGILMTVTHDKTVSLTITVKYKGRTERDDLGSTFVFDLRRKGSSASTQSNSLADQDGVDSYTTVRAHVASFIEKHVTKENRFSDAFLARCALRMYDGNIVSLSAPCLLVPCTGVTPVMYTTGTMGLQKELQDSNGKTYTVRGSKMYVGAMCCDLYVNLGGLADKLESWRDLITGVVIAVTKPIRMYDVSDDKDKLKKSMSIESYSSSEEIASAMTYTKTNGVKALTTRIQDKTGKPSYYVRLPQVDDVGTELEKASNFYIVKEISYEELGDYESWTKIDMKGVSLASLAEREALPDGMAGMGEYYPTKAYAYNNRLHIANYREKMFSGYQVSGMNGNVFGKTYNISETVVEVHEGGSTYYVKRLSGRSSIAMMYYYYPNPNAKRVWVKTGDTVRSVALTRHPAMGGAYWFQAFEEMPEMSEGEMQDGENEVMLDKPGYMRLSEANNPWVYKDVNTYSFDGDVVAVCSAVTALGTGQKGQFDLYIFTKRSGVWSLKINDQGSYTRYVPTARDVMCGDGQSLCQVDGSVVFASKRGVMELSGSVCRCISDEVNDGRYVEMSRLKGLESLNKGEAVTTDGVEEFRSYIEDCVIIYDYRNQRLLVINEYADYHYIYSITGKTWSLAKNRIEYAVNSYPDAYAVYAGCLVNMSGNMDEGIEMNEGGSIIVTRAMKFGDANAMKRVMGVRLNGGRFSCKMILYGSNDLHHWIVVGSASDRRMTVAAGGTAYRFFKLAANVGIQLGAALVSATFNVMVVDDNDKLF